MNGQSVQPKETKALLAILFLAALLRFISANSELWFDEIASLQNYVRLPFHALVGTYGSAGNHVLNSILVHMAIALLGEEPWAMRLPAILFGIAAVWAFWLVAGQLWDTRIALLGTFLFAVSYHHVYYTQQARGYSALVFFALLATAFLLRLVSVNLDGESRSYGAGYAVAIGLGLYSLLLMAFVVVGHGCVLFLARRWRALGWAIAGGVLGALLYAPMGLEMLGYYAHKPAETGLQLFSAAFIGELKPILGVAAIGAALFPPLLWRFWKRHPLATAIISMPLVLNIVVPAARGQGVHPRSFIYGLPVAYFFLMEALDWATPRFRWLVWISVAGLTAVSLFALVRYYPLPKQAFRQALAYVSSNRAPNDRVIAVGLCGRVIRYYDPSVIYVGNTDQLKEWFNKAGEPTWFLYTFPRQLRSSTPELSQWLMSSTTQKAAFPGVIGDGTVYVRLWLPRVREKTEVPSPDESPVRADVILK